MKRAAGELIPLAAATALDIGEALGRGDDEAAGLGMAALRGAASGTGGLLAYRLSDDLLRYAGLPGAVSVPASAIAGLAAWHGLRKWLSPYVDEEKEEESSDELPESEDELRARFLAALRSRYGYLPGPRLYYPVPR